MMGQRTWTMKLWLDGDWSTVPVDDEEFCEYGQCPDLKRETVRYSLAWLIRELELTPGDIEGCPMRLVLFKTTKARGTEPDGEYPITVNYRNGRIVVDGPYAVRSMPQRYGT